MAARPSVDPKWSANDDPNNIIEPTASLKENGIESGGVWGRENLNWMFGALSKWVDWIRSYALDKDNNLSDVASATLAFNNLKQNATAAITGVVRISDSTTSNSSTVAATSNSVRLTKTVADAASNAANSANNNANLRALKTNNLSDLANPSTAFSNIKQAATASASGVVKISNSTTTTSSDTAASSTAVKSAKDVADSAKSQSQVLTDGILTFKADWNGSYYNVQDRLGNASSFIALYTTGNGTVTVDHLFGTLDYDVQLTAVSSSSRVCTYSSKTANDFEIYVRDPTGNLVSQEDVIITIYKG